MRITAIFLVIFYCSNLLAQGKALITLNSGSSKEVEIIKDESKSLTILNDNGKVSKLDRKIIKTIKYLDGARLQKVNGIYEYSKVKTVEGKSADQLFYKAHEWIATVYNSAQDVVQLNSKETHTLIVKGIFTVRHGISRPQVGHTIKIETKEGRYRFTCNQLSIEGQYAMTFEEKVLGIGLGKGLIKSTSQEIKELLVDLHSFLSKTSSSDDDW